MEIEKISVRGKVTISIKRPHQELEEFTIPNLVTNVGKEFIARRVFRPTDETVTADFGQIGIGSGNTPPSADQLDLQGAITRIKSIDYKELVGNELNFITTFADTATDTLIDTSSGLPVPVNEIGLFTDGGNMICRTVLSEPFTKNESDLLSVFWKIEIG